MRTPPIICGHKRHNVDSKLLEVHTTEAVSTSLRHPLLFQPLYSSITLRISISLYYILHVIELPD